MVFGDIPLVGMLKQRMSWHQARQSVLAQNVANADTPGYRARDLSEPQTGSASRTGGVVLMQTAAGHIGPSGASAGASAGGSFGQAQSRTFEITPQGNGVVLEEEVMRVSQNVMDYQMVSQLYSRGLGMLKTAISRRA